MQIVTIIGARPQFIKAAALTRAIAVRRGSGCALSEVVVHTGQHFDDDMSRVFFDELELPEPHHRLGVGGLPHGPMIGRIMAKLEPILLTYHPDHVLVYGDTNSTVAGALAALKHDLPVAHVEAGLRSYNWRMPEESNRVLTDRVSTYLFCPTERAVNNLQAEGIHKNVHRVGDVMYDVVQRYRAIALERVGLDRFDVAEMGYIFATVHREENTDQPERLRAILAAFRDIAQREPVVLTLHPRTRKTLRRLGEECRLKGLRVLGPVSYLETQRLVSAARAVITDSGGLQKEAFFHGVPCLTLRDETEWSETVELGWNRLCGAETDHILAAYHALETVAPALNGPEPYGDGQAAERILDILLEAG